VTIGGRCPRRPMTIGGRCPRRPMTIGDRCPRRPMTIGGRCPSRPMTIVGRCPSRPMTIGDFFFLAILDDNHKPVISSYLFLNFYEIQCEILYTLFLYSKPVAYRMNFFFKFPKKGLILRKGFLGKCKKLIGIFNFK